MEHQLYINDYLVDLSEDIPFPITFSIADIKEPENRKRSVSKTITLKGTQNNKQVFSGAYQLSLSDDGFGLGFAIDPNKRVEARYVKNSREVFSGLCQLMQVNLDNEAYTFEIVLFSDFVNLFQKWDEITVGELGWNEYDHDLNITNIENSWETSVIKNSVATSNFTTGVPDGFGYVYPWIDFGYNNSSRTIEINDFVPYVYVKEVMQKAFSYLDYNIDSTFFDTDLFKSLVFGFGGGKKTMLNPTDKSNRQVNYSFDGTYSNDISPIPLAFYTNGDVYYQALSNIDLPLSQFTETLISDGYTQYDNVSNNIVVKRSGTYKLNVDFDIDMSADFDIGTSNGGTQRAIFQVKKNGIVIGSSNTFSIQTTTTNFAFAKDFDLNLKSGDYIELVFALQINRFSFSSLPNTYTVDFNLNNDFAFDLTSSEGIYLEGDNITLSRFLPNMKVSEFVKGVITMFNLYIDDLNDSTFKIEPLSTFYAPNSDAEDWTNKLDLSRKQEIKPASAISGKSYEFEFDKDNDYYNNFYLDKFNEGYGNYSYDVSNSYQKGSKKFKVPFAVGVPVEESAGFVRPRLINIDILSNTVTPYKGKPKMFFYNGLKTGSVNVNYSGGIYTTASYPQVHHSFEDIENPTFDLLFSKPREVFYNYTNYNEQNIFNNYHRTFTRELSERDAKLYTAYFKLDDLDIEKGMFRNLVKINGVLFRKNIVVDYDATGHSTTKVELLKVLETTEVQTNNPVITLGTGLGGSVGGVVFSPNGVGQGSNVISGGLNSALRTTKIMTGYGNRI